ncbi:MAG TPA: HPF/RaiA family ribosome-associated protein, partial [Segetibacter sp.]
MDVRIQTVHFNGDEKLIELVKRKLEKLDTFHDKITKVDVFLK